MLHSESEVMSQKGSSKQIKKTSENIKVRKYNNEINYNSGVTEHYALHRKLRENELIRLLGNGHRVDAFLVSQDGKDSEIHEVMSNAIINIYSFETHKKITLFAPKPSRIEFLYKSIGEVANEELLMKSEYNLYRGYNKIYNSN